MISNAGSQAASELSEILADYRMGEIEPINESDVVGFALQVRSICTWMEETELNLFLSGLRNCLGRQYWSRTRVASLFESQSMTDAKDIHIVYIQEDKSSQAVFVKLLKQTSRSGLDETKGLSASRLLYVDDATFTGRALSKNLGLLADQLSVMKQFNRELLVFHLMQFDDEVLPRVESAVSRLNTLGVDVKFRSVVQAESPLVNEQFFRLFPSDQMLHDEFISRYLLRETSLKELRNSPNSACLKWPDSSNDPLFTSEKERHIVTFALLQVGIQLRFWTQNWQQLLRPLGFVASTRDLSFGFGSVFCTFHNAANTSPIALWWGDPRAGSYSALSRWKPLIPRRVP